MQSSDKKYVYFSTLFHEKVLITIGLQQGSNRALSLLVTTVIRDDDAGAKDIDYRIIDYHCSWAKQLWHLHD